MAQAQAKKTVTRRTQPRKKKAPVIPRRPRTGLAGAPEDSFHNFNYYFRIELDKKDAAGVIRKYIRSHFKGKEKDLLLSGPDYMYTSKSGIAASIEWANRGFDFPEKWNHERYLNNYLEKLRELATQKLEQKKSEEMVITKITVSPMDKVKARTSNFIGYIDELLDKWEDLENFSLYNELLKEGASSYTAKEVLEFFRPRRDEIDELVNVKTKDLVEGYSYMKVATRKKFLEFLNQMISDCEKYLLSKKATRKVTKPKVKTADKQVAQIKYAKDSQEYKLTSIDPKNIVGASRLYTFNVKERMITEFVTNSPNGFEMKGTTLQNFDPEKSRSIRLRKPEESLTIFQKNNVRNIDIEWSKLTTKTVKPTGRINKDTILLRVMNT